jgi:hypothetical protein
MVIAFSTVFIASGAMFLGPRETVPDEENMLNLQAQFVTQIHAWLLPLYLIGAFLTMQGTLYGTIEIACSIADEIARSFDHHWTEGKASRLKRGVLLWCAPIAMSILVWLAVRQANPQPAAVTPTSTQATIAQTEAESKAEQELPPVQKPRRILLAILTPVNLFTGVLSCGLICVLALWMDRRWLPPELQPPIWLNALNVVSAIVFLGLGLKGYWDNENRIVAVGGMFGLLFVSMILAKMYSSRQAPTTSSSVPSEKPLPEQPLQELREA